MGASTVKIIGFCRFSFFGPSDTRLSYDDEQEAYRQLYADRRMQSRFFLFENLLLPSIACQNDTDFKLTILTSQIMPKRYRNRLSALCETVPQIDVHFAKDTNLKNVMKPMLQEASSDGADELVQFRIDDDDAVSCNYVERLRALAAQSPAQKIISMPTGLMVYQTPKRQGIGRIFRPFTGAGFAFHAQKGRHRQVFQFAHNQAKKFFRTVSDPTGCSHIQSVHLSSDTGQRQEKRVREYLSNAGKPKTPTEIEDILGSSFPFISYKQLDHVRQTMNGF